MSTRANVIIKDGRSTVYLYRHSDGYPEVTGADLKAFVKDYQSGAMRLDTMQSSGWLIVRGHKEYLEKPFTGKPDISDKFSGWKVGAYECTDQLHGDVEYIYIIDLVACELDAYQTKSGYWEAPSIVKTKKCADFPTVSFKREAEK